VVLEAVLRFWHNSLMTIMPQECVGVYIVMVGTLLGEVCMNVRVLVLGSTSTHECRSTGTQQY
jgi:hypothetical protein